MLNHRDRGYATLHKLILLCSLFVWFWISLDLWNSLDYSLINLPWNYALVAIAGLTVATLGSFQHYGLFFMKNGWGRIRESLVKANFQTALIAFFVFVATKIMNTSLKTSKTVFAEALLQNNVLGFLIVYSVNGKDANLIPVIAIYAVCQYLVFVLLLFTLLKNKSSI